MSPERPQARLGHSLLEILLTLSLFSLVAALTYIFLSQGMGLSRKLTGADQARLQLHRAHRQLEEDLSLAPVASIREAPVVISSTPDGDAVWFLSALDATGRELSRRDSGSPSWRRNILYYLVIPDRHREVFRLECSEGPGPGGFDDRCSHKVLVRKVIDNPSGPPEEEALLEDVGAYLSRPDGLRLSVSGEPGVETAEIVATGLLWFQVELPEPGEVAVDLRAAATEEAQKSVRLGEVSLFEGRFTQCLLFSAFPRN